MKRFEEIKDRVALAYDFVLDGEPYAKTYYKDAGWLIERLDVAVEALENIYKGQWEPEVMEEEAREALAKIREDKK